MIFGYPPEVKEELEELGRIERWKMMGKAVRNANVGGRGAYLLFAWLFATIVVLHFGVKYGDSDGLVALIGVVLVLLLYCLSNHYFLMHKLVYPKFIELMNDDRDQKALSDIKEYGCHVLNVTEGDVEPSFTYTIGINQKQNKPDVVILGLKAEIAHSMANHYKDRLLSGEGFEPGKLYADFLGNVDVSFVKVAKRHYNEYFGWGLWLHGGSDFEMLQMVWPTTDGLWPWSEDTTELYQWAQPILNENGVLMEI